MQTLANNRLLDAFTAGEWDGNDLDTELARLDTTDGVRYVFCPVDPRFTRRPDGRWEPAGHEPDVALSPTTRAELDALVPAMLERWRADGADPRAVRQILELLASLGWSEAGGRASWLLVRAWLRQQPDILRVGQDYWIMVDWLPQGPDNARLRVMPVRSGPIASSQPVLANETTGEEGATPEERTQTRPLPSGTLLPGEGWAAGIAASWTATLRTVNLVAGFIAVPAAARGAYPPRAVGAGTWDVVRGKWFDTNEDLWVWLDRDHDRLCGPELADKVAWYDAGQRMRVEWAQDLIILRLLEVDAEVQREEARLVDAEALATLRGGLGESYRRSLQAILGDAPDGLTFAELVARIRERQGHQVHRGTVRALLSTAGFVQRDGRWYAAPDVAEGARRLRSALTQTLVGRKTADASQEAAQPLDLSTTVRAIHDRLRELTDALHDTTRRDL